MKGNNKINSTSNTKKIKVTKKKRKDRGIRLSVKVENPHSKGLSFSRSVVAFLLKMKIRTINTKEIINISTVFIKNIKIFYRQNSF